tara:strand:+ start:180 stop:455 length:276 start_codon:yes stop_codon:yes gene_type:complete
MKQKIPDIIKEGCFSCFSVLNEAEIAVIMMGDEAYRESLNLENNDAPCWVMPSGETHGFVGWNTQCVPTIDYIAWKLERLDLVRRGIINEL